MAHILIMTLSILILSLSNGVEARQDIRVLILNEAPRVTIESDWGFEIPQGLDSNKIIIEENGIDHNPFRVIPRGDYLILNGKRYRGGLEIRKGDKGLYVINELDLEDYLKGVVPQEIDHRWDLEALMAQAIVARTYALYYMKENQGKEYHLDSSIMNQVYNGMDGERFRTTYAVMETEGIVLTYEGKVIEAFYHKSCGGHTEDSRDVWAKDAPYLRGVECLEKGEVWERTIRLREIEEALKRDGNPVGKVLRVEIASTSNTGRVTYLRISVKNGASNGSLFIKGNDFRRLLGYTRVPSANFRIEDNGEEIKLYGKGAGHGVGFCQIGAKEMAGQGKDFREILRHYYTGIEIGNLGDL